MSWEIRFLSEASEDLRKLDGSQRILIAKALKKVSANPLPMDEGGYGKPLGNHTGTHLAGLLKIKLRGAGLRIVYKIVRTEESMTIIVIGARADELVYQEAKRRADKYHL